ncbi:MAG: hypothetical protein NUW37_15055 [Planctomycetes bacterium]|nr:hypothetical protein [Planctomycetota bacterium]
MKLKAYLAFLTLLTAASVGFQVVQVLAPDILADFAGGSSREGGNVIYLPKPDAIISDIRNRRDEEKFQTAVDELRSEIAMLRSALQGERDRSDALSSRLETFVDSRPGDNATVQAGATGSVTDMAAWQEGTPGSVPEAFTEFVQSQVTEVLRGIQQRQMEVWRQQYTESIKQQREVRIRVYDTVKERLVSELYLSPATAEDIVRVLNERDNQSEDLWSEYYASDGLSSSYYGGGMSLIDTTETDPEEAQKLQAEIQKKTETLYSESEERLNQMLTPEQRMTLDQFVGEAWSTEWGGYGIEYPSEGIAIEIEESLPRSEDDSGEMTSE